MDNLSEAMRRQWLWALATHIKERMGGKVDGLQRLPKPR